jgi:sortase A
MSERKTAENLSVKELEELLYRKKRQQRQQRLERMAKEGRLIVVDGLTPPNPTPPSLNRPNATPTGAMRNYILVQEEEEAAAGDKSRRPIQWRWIFNTFLLLIEIGAVVGLVAVLGGLWLTRQELNQELVEVQRAQVVEVALPTPTATPVIGMVVLPSGHKPPIEGRPPEEGEAGDIPSHLLPVLNAYVPPPIPTPGPEQARRIQIPAIGVDSTIVQGVDWDQLKKGVGQLIGSAQPGQNSNLVLAAHNDIFGEIFRHLDRLTPGDEIIVSTERQAYRYVVRAIEVVPPTAVQVMDPTPFGQATLISCYPYQINTQRIVVFADLVQEAPGA